MLIHSDSNTRERTPYEADGFINARSRWVLQREWNWLRHSAAYVAYNPTWPTEWKQYMVMLAYEDYMRSGSTELAMADYDYQHLVLNSMISFIHPETQLVDWTSSFHWNEQSWPQVCHSDPAGAIPDSQSEASFSCDNIDWPPQKGNPGDSGSPGIPTGMILLTRIRMLW